MANVQMPEGSTELLPSNSNKARAQAVSVPATQATANSKLITGVSAKGKIDNVSETVKDIVERAKGGIVLKDRVRPANISKKAKAKEDAENYKASLKAKKAETDSKIAAAKANAEEKVNAAKEKVEAAKAQLKAANNDDEKAAAEAKLEAAKEALKTKKEQAKENAKNAEKAAKNELAAWKALAK